MSNRKFYVYTDGACLNNGKKNSIGAIGIFFSESDPDNVGQIIDNEGNKVTNQTMELLAAVQAMRLIEQKIISGLIKPKIIHIYTDSSYMINSMTKWYDGWVKNGWKNSKGKDVENRELIEALYELTHKERIVIFKHIRSHQNPPDDTDSEAYKYWFGNYMADKLATTACKEYLQDKQKEKEKEEEAKLEELLDSDKETNIENKVIGAVKKIANANTTTATNTTTAANTTKAAKTTKTAKSNSTEKTSNDILDKSLLTTTSKSVKTKSASKTTTKSKSTNLSKSSKFANLVKTDDITEDITGDITNDFNTTKSIKKSANNGLNV